MSSQPYMNPRKIPMPFSPICSFVPQNPSDAISRKLDNERIMIPPPRDPRQPSASRILVIARGKTEKRLSGGGHRSCYDWKPSIGSFNFIEDNHCPAQAFGLWSCLREQPPWSVRR